MPSTILGPLKKSLRRAYGLADTVERETAALIGVIEQADIDASEFEALFEQYDAAARQLVQTIKIGRAKAREMRELPSAADKMANSVMVVEGLDQLASGIPGYELARQIEVTEQDTLELALTELASYEGGLDRLILIMQIGERVLQGQGPTRTLPKPS